MTNWFYWLVLGLIILRVVTMFNTWAFVDGSGTVLGHFLAEATILTAYINLLREKKLPS